MRRGRLWFLLIVLLAGAFCLAYAACRRSAAVPSATATPSATPTATLRPSATPSPTATSTPTATPSPTPDAASALLSRLTLEDKAGQLIMATLPGPAVDEYARHAVLDLRVGGVILLRPNAQSPEQLRAFTGELQALAQSRAAPVPLFVSINHEGGTVVHIGEGVTVFPDAMALGAAGSPDLAYAVGRAGAEELAGAGINMNLAPVLDVNTEAANPVIGLRSFGADPGAVSALGTAFIRGTQAAGVIAVGKHFPGHGSVAVDSHYALPVVEASGDEIAQVALAPFREAIAGGVEAIMSAHLAVPALTGDPALPATLSHAVMTDLLRGSLGFHGLILTDDLDMQGIAAQESPGEAAVRAVEAGADVLLFTRRSSQEAALQALLDAVRSGRLSEARLDESVRRILALKLRYGLFDPAGGAPSAADLAEHQALARQVAEAAVTQVRADGLPLAAGRRTLVISPRDLPAGQEEGWTLFGEELRRRAPDCRELLYDAWEPASQERLLAEAPALAMEYDQVVVGLWSAFQQQVELGDDTPFRLVQALAGLGKPVVVVALQLPYDLARVPEGVGAVATYGDTPEQVRAATGVLFGELPATGRLPVPLTR